MLDENRYFFISSCIYAHVRGFPSEYHHPVWCAKTSMVWLPDGEKILKISLFVLAQIMNVTHRQTLHASNSRAYA